MNWAFDIGDVVRGELLCWTSGDFVIVNREEALFMQVRGMSFSVRSSSYLILPLVAHIEGLDPYRISKYEAESGLQRTGERCTFDAPAALVDL